jgi:hypothetical protein
MSKMSNMSKMSKLDGKKLGAAMLVALIAGVAVAGFAAVASAHGYGGYGYGGYGYRGMMGYGMPMMGMGGMMGYGGYGFPYQAGEGEEHEEREGLKEVTGKVTAIYSMSVKLDSGYYIRLPWWFAEEIGIEKDASIKAKGFEYRSAIPTIIPTYIEVNGQAFGDESSALPVWMQGFEDEGYGYGGYGYGYGYGYHCPMMGW